MDFNNYSHATEFTRLLGNPITAGYAFLGLMGESGEVADHLKIDLKPKDSDLSLVDYLNAAELMKKAVRTGEMQLPQVDASYTKEEIVLELGDVLWYLNTLCICVGTSLDEVAQANIDKLTARHKP